jgi:hypothetical protein
MAYPFILFRNLASNTISIRYYSMQAAGKDPNATREAVIGIAISALTASISSKSCLVEEALS